VTVAPIRPLKLHDTMSRKLVEVTPGPDGIVRFYCCGPTINNYAHVGNGRLFTWQDVLRRTLLARGYRVRHVMNITDIEDKIIDQAREAGLDITDPARLPEYTAKYEQGFRDDLASLRILPSDVHPKATEFVPRMIALCERLIERGHAYASDGSVYFKVTSLPQYGALSRLDVSALQGGARVDSDKYEKDDVRDFVLWKASKEGEPVWQSPWGPGRPGWHLECSVMAMDCLGSETIDLHVGGEDLVFPHHENEIAQSEGATGKPFCKLWVHCAFLRVDGTKMSKSLGNFHTVRELVEEGHDPAVLRYFLASAHYRSPLNLTDEGLEGARKAVERLNEFARLLATARPATSDDAALLASIRTAARELDDALGNDLNTSGALGALFGFVREVNGAIAGGTAGTESIREATELLKAADAIFCFLPPEALGVRSLWRDIAGKRYEVTGLGDVPEDVLESVIARQEARAARDFARADVLRTAITSGGWILEDVPGGARVKKNV
jgi:cysteinyl-tRNA synthetase